MTKAQNASERGTRAECGPGSATHAQGCCNARDGRFCLPADLAAFIVRQPIREIAKALSIGIGSAHQLRHGQWHQNAQRLLDAWRNYKGRESGWFLRRVHAGGTVRHAGRTWTALGLAERAGQTLAVARAADGSLLAQTLDMPHERVALVRVDAQAIAATPVAREH